MLVRSQLYIYGDYGMWEMDKPMMEIENTLLSLWVKHLIKNSIKRNQHQKNKAMKKRIKITLLVLALLVLAVLALTRLVPARPVPVTAIGNDRGCEANGIYYMIDGNEAVVTFRGIFSSEDDEYTGSVVIPSAVNFNGVTYSVTSIGDEAFDECTGLTSIVIPNSVTSIGECAFMGCTGLTSIDIPNSVTSIGRQAFDGCTGLTSINIPNSETSIDEYAFRGCTGLTSIVIPNSVTDIGAGAFHGCTGLTSIVVESGNPRYDSRNNCNAIIETANNTLIYGCNNTIIPNTVTSIGRHAFYECAGLTSIDIPNSVTFIGAWAFYYCTEVTSINIPNSVTSIENRAFIGCTGDVYSYIDNLSLVSMDSDVFYMYPPNYNKRTLHVPVGSSKAYQADSRWSEFFGNIVEMKP